MANTAEGITVGDQEGLDPNDPGAFEAIMADRGVAKQEGEASEPDRSIASGLTEAGPEPGRGPDGRFISNQEASDTPAAEATDTSGEESGAAAEDPETAAFLAKYGGDVNAALKGAANAQALIGRRDEESAALKNEVAELRGKVDGMAAVGAQPRQAPLSDEQISVVATGQVEEKGYFAAATDAANVAAITGDERPYRTILEQWVIEDPLGATDFNTDFRLWQREQRAAPAAVETPAWQISAEEQHKLDQYEASLTGLRDELGDAFPAVAANLETALGQMPKNVLAMIDSPDAEARDQGFRIVADRALRLSAAAGAAAATTPVTAPASVERKLSGARVASGALRPAEKTTAATPQTREDAISAFKRSIVEAPTTSVASGLTYGPTP